MPAPEPTPKTSPAAFRATVPAAPSAAPSSSPSDGDGTFPRERREATVAEAKALAHPVRQRIVGLCGLGQYTNKQLADRLGRDPGTTLYHLKILVGAGFLEPGEVRTGPSGALEKPYRSTGKSWWLSDPLGRYGAAVTFGPVETYIEGLREAGPAAVATYAKFPLHLSAADVEELDRRLLAVIDQYIETDHERADQPVHAGLVVLHRVADGGGAAAP